MTAQAVIDETAHRFLEAALVGRGHLADDVLQSLRMHHRHRLVAMLLGKVGQDAPAGVSGGFGETIGEAIRLQISDHRRIDGPGFALVGIGDLAIVERSFISRHEGRAPRQTGEWDVLSSSAMEVITSVSVSICEGSAVAGITAFHCTLSHGLGWFEASPSSKVTPSGFITTLPTFTPARSACFIARAKVM